MPRILVLGATSMVGYWLLPQLVSTGHTVVALSRKARLGSCPESVEWHIGDARTADGANIASTCDTVVSLLPLWLFSETLNASSFMTSRRIIALGSTSVLSKHDSPDIKERHLAERLRNAEDNIVTISRKRNASLTLLRPTLIYDGQRDQNVTRIAQVLMRYRCFPIFGEGNGRRQPIHADDVAKAIVAAITHNQLPKTAYNLSGGETLTYRQMVQRIAMQENLRVAILRIPRVLIYLVVACTQRLPGFHEINAAMLDRMNRDLVFDHDDATCDFGFSPRPFLGAREKRA